MVKNKKRQKYSFENHYQLINEQKQINLTEIKLKIKFSAFIFLLSRVIFSFEI